MAIAVNEDNRDKWRAARLLPTVGIRGQEEQELRATSSLLAVIRAVPEFGHALVGALGAPRGRITTYTEIRFAGEEGRTQRPDGAIVVERAGRAWVCLVEVKTSTAELRSEQVSRYLDIARDSGFDAVLTISSQITARPAISPVEIDRRKLRRVNLWHLSWWRILTEAILQHRYHKISDPDQAWILGELISYLDDEASGASGFHDMGDRWVTVRDSARAGTLRAADAAVPMVAARWSQLIQFLCLGLSQELGHEVSPLRAKGKTPEEELEAIKRELVELGQLTATLKVPRAIAPIELRADLRTRTLTTGVGAELPDDSRALTRIKWLTRQLDGKNPELRLTVSFPRVRTTTSALLAKAQADPKCLLAPDDPKREPRRGTVEWTKPLGLKRGRGPGSFVGETQGQLTAFYADVVQTLRPWRAPAPRLNRTSSAVDDGALEAEPSSVASEPMGPARQPPPTSPLLVDPAVPQDWTGVAPADAQAASEPSGSELPTQSEQP